MRPTIEAPRPIPETWPTAVDARVRAELGWRVTSWRELGTGTNNRLVRLDLAEGPPLLAKFYARDRWDRLGTEFLALALLAERGVGGVPRPYLRDDELNYALYSFEPGVRKAPAAVTEEDARAAAGLAAALHAFGPRDDESVGPANAACYSVADHLRLIESRLCAYEVCAADPACRDEVRAFATEVDLRAAVDRLVAAATAGMTEAEVAAALPRAAWRLNSYDFGPHNLLFDDGGQVTLVDFEGAGWDDPARMVMGCVSHIGSQGLSPAAIAAFLGTYAELRQIDDAEMGRYERVGMLYDVEWATVFAAALAPEAAVAKQFGTPGFDLSAHVQGCIAGVRARLAWAERSGGYQAAESSAGGLRTARGVSAPRAARRAAAPSPPSPRTTR